MERFWRKFARPALFRFDAEAAHEIGIRALRRGFARPFYARETSYPEFGSIERFGLTFSNPIGLAAGFDKNGVAVDQLASLGFGFVEVGTVTYRPQSGNPKPRLFRLPEDEALINRLGFNNDGARVVEERLRKVGRKFVVGVNIGKNKEVPNEEAVENYLACFDLLRPAADYVAVNVSSPNTPGLRELQRTENLDALLSALQRRNEDPMNSGRTSSFRRSASVKPKPRTPLLVKISPDLKDSEIREIVDLCLARNVDGVIATNTTVSRDGLKTPDVERFGPGGLSGRPIAEKANHVISTIYKHSNGKLPIVGVGGIFSAQDVFEKIAAGASLVQAYTGFVYGGPKFAQDLSRGLAELLERGRFTSLDEAVGYSIRG